VAAVTPGLGGLIGREQYRTTAELRGEMISINWLLVTSIGSTILMTNRSFLQLWVGEQHYAGSWANLLIILIMVQTTFIRADAYVIDATLKLRDRVVVSGIAAVFSIALSILLTHWYGIVGLCVGILAGRFVQTVSYPFLVNSCLGLRAKLRLTGVLRPVLTMCLCFAGGVYFGERFVGRNWVEWFGCVAVTFVLSLFLAFTVGLPSDSRLSVVKRITKIRQSASWIG
jgi:O-antigen/teichoic acid export membrane protein